MDARFGGRARRAAAWAVLSTLALGRVVMAQNVGTITGSVKDQQGLAIPGATVSALKNRVSRRTRRRDRRAGPLHVDNVAFGTYVAERRAVRVHSRRSRSSRSGRRCRSLAMIQLKLGRSRPGTITCPADALLETSSTGSHVDIGATLIDRCRRQRRANSCRRCCCPRPDSSPARTAVSTSAARTGRFNTSSMACR